MSFLGKLRDNYEFFIDYDVVKVYYDNGQVEITKLLSSVFNALRVNLKIIDLKKDTNY